MPGDTPHENAQFLVFCAAVIRAVHKFAGLLRVSVASATNDHRLGANEAPPAIISIFLGEQLADVFEQIAKGAATSSKGKGTMIIGVDTLPMLPTDPGDRNRTSPFAFTGNRFEFRAPGSGQTITVPMIILNTIMADSLDYMATLLEKAVGDGEDFDKAVQKLLTEIITEHGAVVFNGDGYSENWQIEAAERGLPNLKTTLDAIPELVKPEAVEVFEKYGVFNERELHSRYEVRYEQYALTVAVEAKLTLEIGIDGDPAGGDPLPDRAGAERRDAQGGRRGADTTLLEAVSSPDRGADRGADGAQGGAGASTAATRQLDEAAARAGACCRRWTRCAPPPTRWKALWPTTCGRCPPTRRCSTSSEYARRIVGPYSGSTICTTPALTPAMNSRPVFGSTPRV